MGIATERMAPLMLSSGEHLLQKKRGPCEDSSFIGVRSLGVADGVGCMVQFASYGINAADYANDLMQLAKKYMEESLERRSSTSPEELEAIEVCAAKALIKAECNATTFGAATITVMAMEGRNIGVANLGDSGFMLLR